MTRQKKPMLVYAFNTTTGALVLEDICKLGRVIPLPSEVAAGCGLAYCVDLQHEDEVDGALGEQGLVNFKKQVVTLYL